MSNLKPMNIISAFQIAQSRKRKIVNELASDSKENSFNSVADDDVSKHMVNSEKHFDDQDKIVMSILKELLVKVSDNIVSINSEQFTNGNLEKDISQTQDRHNSTLENSMSLSDNNEISEKDSSSLILNSSVISSDVNSSVTGPSASNRSVPNFKKKRRKMSAAEAKQRTELRMRKEKLKEEKRLAKEAEKQRKENERNLAKLQKLQKKEEEEREKEKLRQEKKEQEDKEKLQKQLEKEERLKLKNMIQEAKAEEKKKKEQQKTKLLEEKLKTFEDKKKLDEEKMKMELEKEKQKAKTKQAFAKFFLKSSSANSASSPQLIAKESVFLPFQVSEDMVLAPVIPVSAKKRFDKDTLDYHLENQDCSTLYLENLKSDKNEYVCQKKKRPNDKNTAVDDIVIVDVEPLKSRLKGKLFQFHENIRPPYFGTWRKRSKNIKPRRPLAQDDIFDYEVDSDEEWDEGGPGESLTGTEDEESEDDYEVDNEFFVPHGYLSAEEEGEDEVAVDPEIQKVRLKMKEKEFLSERNRKTTELKPIILGCYFQTEVANGDLVLEKTLCEFAAEVLTTKDVLTAFTVGSKLDHNEQTVSSSSPKENRALFLRRPVPEEAYPYLIRLLHGNTNSRQNVIKEFQNFWLQHCEKADVAKVDLEQNSATPDVAANVIASPVVRNNGKISKRQLAQCITAIAVWCKSPHPTFKKLCWWVKDDIIQKFELKDLPIPNEWTYTTKSTEDASAEQSPVSLKLTSSQ